MSMISEQVRRLHEFAKTLKYADEYNLVNGAADTIWELSAKLHNSQMERSNQYYNGGWIPVSERLPEIHQDVILSLRSLEIEVGFRAETEPHFYCHGADGCYIDPKNVLAWMPLPEPYKEEGSDKE